MRLVPKERQVAPVGSHFGRLTIIGESFYIPVGRRNKRDQMVVAECSCGTIRVLMAQNIAAGHVTSCGCFRRGSFADSGRRHFRTHGASSTRLYRIWDSMRRRCENPNHAAYYLYGARGIRICEPWRTFEPFREWALAHGYKSGLSIDRIRSNGDYEPDNCQWITRSENTTRMHIDHGHKTAIQEAVCG